MKRSSFLRSLGAIALAPSIVRGSLVDFNSPVDKDESEVDEDGVDIEYGDTKMHHQFNGTFKGDFIESEVQHDLRTNDVVYCYLENPLLVTEIVNDYKFRYVFFKQGASSPEGEKRVMWAIYRSYSLEDLKKL